MAVFFTFIGECCVVIEKNIEKKLANVISYQIRYKRCLKGKFGRGGGVAIWTGGSKSAVTLAPVYFEQSTRLTNSSL